MVHFKQAILLLIVGLSISSSGYASNFESCAIPGMGTVYATCCTNPAPGYDHGWLVSNPNTGMPGPCGMYPNSTSANNCDESTKAIAVSNPSFNGTLRQFLDSLGGCKTESTS